MCSGFTPGSVKTFMDKKPNYDTYAGSVFNWKEDLTNYVVKSKDYNKSYMYFR